MQEKNKICHVTMHYYPTVGGQEFYIKNLNNVLLKNHYEASVMQRYVKNIKTDENVIIHTTSILFKKAGNILGILIPNIDWLFFNIGLIFKKRILRSDDILICHYPFHFPAIKWHKKVIILSHGVLWSKITPTLFDRYHKWISNRAKEKNITIVANDTDFLREIGYNVKPKQVYFSQVIPNVWFIPNCVDTELFSRNENIKKEKIILVPRNIRPDRGIHLAIESFKKLQPDLKDFKLIIAGRGKGKYFKYCQSIVKNYNLSDSVYFIGHTDQNKMLELYNKATVTLIPTIEKEGTSLSALESMSCGTPTIVTPIGGLLDLPAYITSLDPEIMAKDIKYAINNSNTLSLQQQKDVKEGFNMKLWEDAWIKVIKSLKT